MYELIQPFINDILVGIFGLLTTIVLAIFAELRKRVLTWIDSRNDLKHKEYLRYVAEEAFAFIEATMKDAKSQEKIAEAIYFASKQLEKKGINITTSEIRSAIERAVLEYNSKNK